MVIALWIALGVLLLSASTVLLFACFAVSGAEAHAEDVELAHLQQHGAGDLSKVDFAGDS